MQYGEFISVAGLTLTVVTALIGVVWKLSGFSSTFSESIKVLGERLNEVKESRADAAKVVVLENKVQFLESAVSKLTERSVVHDGLLQVVQHQLKTSSEWRSKREDSELRKSYSNLDEFRRDDK